MAPTKDPDLIRIRNPSDKANYPVFEHRCAQSRERRHHRFRPKIMYLKAWSSKGPPEWCLCWKDERVPIQTCPFCDNQLQHPLGYDCTCGAEAVRLHRGTHAFEIMHNFQVDGKVLNVKALVYVESFLHDDTCRAGRLTEEDGSALF